MSDAAPTEPLYDADQTPALLKLLAEYTAKLGIECKKYAELEETISKAKVKAAAWFVFFLALLIYGDWLTIHPLGAASNSYLWKDSLVIEGINTLAGIGTGFLAVGIIELRNMIIKSRRKARSSINFAANQLERLVRRLSPATEHGKVGLAEKLELDLRLADADTALEYAARYVGKKEH